MTGLIGDRKEKSILDEMEEVARARNKEVAEEERLEKLEAARRAKEEAARKEKEIEAPSEPAKENIGSIIAADYHGLEWDLNVLRTGYKGLKTAWNYDKSLERLKKEGKRHPLPSEVFTLLADNLEGKLTGDLKATADDMLDDSGEWLSLAVERQESRLMLYSHPEGLVWSEKNYERGPDFKCSQVFEYYLGNVEPNTWLGLKKFQDEFVQFMYGRKFAELSQTMQLRGGVYLPPSDGKLYPVATSILNMGITYEFYPRASRGVKEKAEVPTHAERTGPPGSINDIINQINQVIEQREREGRTK